MPFMSPESIGWVLLALPCTRFTLSVPRVLNWSHTVSGWFPSLPNGSLWSRLRHLQQTTIFCSPIHVHRTTHQVKPFLYTAGSLKKRSRSQGAAWSNQPHTLRVRPHWNTSSHGRSASALFSPPCTNCTIVGQNKTHWNFKSVLYH